MKNLLLFGSIFVIQNVFAANKEWPKQMVSDLKNKTLAETFCKKPLGYFSQPLCNDEKTSKILKLKLSAVSIVGNNGLSISDGVLTVVIERGKTPGVFIVNKKPIDVHDYPSSEDLRNKIQSILPKVSWYNLVIPKAQARERSYDEKIGLLTKSVEMIMRSTVETEVCASLEIVSKTCGALSPSETNLKGILEPETFKRLTEAAASDPEKAKALKQQINGYSETIHNEFKFIRESIVKIAAKKEFLSKCPRLEGTHEKTTWEVTQLCYWHVRNAMAQPFRKPEPGKDWPFAAQIKSIESDLRELTSVAPTADTAKGISPAGAASQAK